MAVLYIHSIGNQLFKMRDSVPIVSDIPAFVMYCIYGESHSFLLIESTDSYDVYNYQFFIKISSL